MGEDIPLQEPSIDGSDSGSGSGHEALPLQKETIAYNNVVSVPLHNGQNLTYMGGELIAKLRLGGTDDKGPDEALPAEELDVYSVHNLDDPDYKRLVENSLKGRSTSKLVAVRPPDETQLGAIAFIPEHHPSTIGREGTVQWYEMGSCKPLPENQPIFNRSVSRRQLAVHVREGQLIFIGAATAPEGYLASRTEIEAPSIQKLGS